MTGSPSFFLRYMCLKRKSRSLGLGGSFVSIVIHYVTLTLHLYQHLFLFYMCDLLTTIKLQR